MYLKVATFYFVWFQSHYQTERPHLCILTPPACSWVIMDDNSYLELDVISGQGPVMVQPVGRDEALGESLLQVRAQPVLVDVGQQTNHTLCYEDDHQQDCVLKYNIGNILFLIVECGLDSGLSLSPRQGGACSRRRWRSNPGER